MFSLIELPKFLINEKFDLLPSNWLRRSDSLLRLRVWVYSVAFVHLVFLAIKLLPIDFTEAEDPTVWPYEKVKWKLITCWFNLIAMVYMPLCAYCDWKELRGEGRQKHVKYLNTARYFCFTSILFPTTAFADILFWRLWIKDRELLAPSAVDKFVPFWIQHCMHSITMVFNILDLVLVERKTPKSFIPGLTLMSLFMVVYLSVCIDSYRKEEYLYPVLKLMSGFKLCVLCLYILVEHLFYFFTQFIVNEFVWSKRKIENKCYKL